MTTRDLQKLEELQCLQDQFEDVTISSGYTSDLLSDVMAHAEEGAALITIQAHKNTVAVASLTGVAAIIICNSRPVGDDVIAAARDEDIAVFLTAQNQFQTSSLLAQHLAGCPMR